MKHLALLAVVVAVAPSVAQENAVVTGRVTNASGAPETAVAIRLLPDGGRVTTDATGAYRLVIPGARIRAGSQRLVLSVIRPGQVVHSAQVRAASCDSVAFDIRMAARGRVPTARADRGIQVATDVLELCSRIRSGGAVLRRIELRGAGERDLLTALGQVAGLRYSIGTAGGRPSLRIGGHSADVDPAVYLDGERTELAVLARMRASDAAAVWIRPGHVAPGAGESAAPGGIIRIIRASHGVSADSLMQRLDGFWWPPLPPRQGVGAARP